jgi:3-keto-disaccharide hydrolase
MNRIVRLLTAASLVAFLALASVTRAGDDKGFVDLFNGKNMDGFKFNIFGKGSPNPFSVKEEVIHVTGNPNGYFYTEKSYKNYVLRYDWKYLKDGNSGLLVHIQSHGKSWPKCIEVQGMQSDHGHIFDIGGLSGGKYKLDKAAQKKAIKTGEWNTTEVTSKDGQLTAKINGIEVASGKASITEGPIGWQSEGAPLQFKNLKIKVLD